MFEHTAHGWEYHTQLDPVEADLVTLGAAGWELTTIDPRDGRFFFQATGSEFPGASDP